MGGFGENIKGTINLGHLREDWGLCFVLFVFKRERESEQGWGRVAEVERESQADSTPSAEPDSGLDLTILRS